MSGIVVDLFLLYHFLKRLTTPFEKWDAFQHGIIDKDGKVLIKRRDLTTKEQRDSFRLFDVLVLNLKKLLAKIPGGSSRIATYAAALLLLREHNNPHSLKSPQQLNEQLMTIINENVPTNAVGGGAIAGVGVGPQGEPPVGLNAIKKLLRRRRNKVVLRRLRKSRE